jgi:hypothetical protein
LDEPRIATIAATPPHLPLVQRRISMYEND